MRKALRVLLTVFVALHLALAGVSVDLCACDETSHGVFCADTPLASSTSSGSCCAGEPEGPSRSPSSLTPSTDCHCPVVDIPVSPVVTTALVAANDGGERTPLVLPFVGPPPSPPSTSVAVDRIAWSRSPPGSHPGIRRHLELQVLRC